MQNEPEPQTVDRPSDADQPRPRPLGSIDYDENKICEIHRHPFGLFSMYLLSAVGVGAALVLAAFLLPEMLTLDADQTALILMVLVIVGGVVFMGLLLATYVYRQSRLIVTDKNITQIIQASLFNRKISQLSMANVEDVTAEQNGFFAHMFNFGTLNIETAGEQENFHFIYCPNPNSIAKDVLEAREKFIADPRYDERRLGRH
jgi:uncharacterized membrane protein YdbT with pleckstrin-like domain